MGLRRATGHEPLHRVVERAHPRDRDGLVAQLRDASADRRRWAARDLSAHPDAAAVLGAALAREADTTVREALFTSLAAMPGPQAADALVSLLRSEDAHLRNGAIESLAGMPDQAGERLQALLGDGDPDVRLFAVNLLTDLRHPQVPRWLEQVLATEPEVNVVAAAVDVLAEVGAPSQLAALRAAARRFPDDAFLGFAVDVATARLEAA